jgi:hypothetical protein
MSGTDANPLNPIDKGADVEDACRFDAGHRDGEDHDERPARSHRETILGVADTHIYDYTQRTL